MLTGKAKFAFSGKTKTEMLVNIVMTIDSVVPGNVSANTKGLILSMLTAAELRPTFKMLELHPMLAKYIQDSHFD